MSTFNYLPGGYESDSDDDYLCYGDYESSSKPKFEPVAIVKSPLELKKEALLVHLKENQLDAIKDELDHGPCKGFDIDEKLDGRWNLLYHACDLGRSEILEYLIEERGVNVHMTEGDADDSPLMVACCSHADPTEVLKVVKVLVGQNVNVRASNNYGVTPLMLASSRGHVEVVKCLLSLNDSFDAIDNEGRNALFHAVEGKQVEVAKILMKTGIDLNVVNKYGDSAKDYASNDNNLEILELFPPEVYQYVPPPSFISYNRFEDLIPELTTDVPDYFPDLVKMLRGMNCEKFLNIFAQAEVTLEEFLTISDERLKEIGIEFPYERKMILFGLFKFHNAQWSRRSLYAPHSLKEDLSPLDLVLILANVQRQLMIIQTQFVYMKKRGAECDLSEAYNYFSFDHLSQFGKKVKTLEGIVKDIIATSKPSKPLLITKKRKKPLMKTVVIFAVAAAVPFVFVFKSALSHFRVFM